MNSLKKKRINKINRHHKTRKTVKGTAERPRMSVYKSNQNIYVQLIDDQASKTIIGLSTKSMKLKQGANIEAAKIIGTEVAKRAKEKKINNVVFDRGGNLYHGVIKQVAESAREAGLKI